MDSSVAPTEHSMNEETTIENSTTIMDHSNANQPMINDVPSQFTQKTEHEDLMKSPDIPPKKLTQETTITESPIISTQKITSDEESDAGDNQKTGGNSLGNTTKDDKLNITTGDHNNVFESPKKKGTPFKLPIFTHDLATGNETSPHTLQPLIIEDNNESKSEKLIIDENSKVIISSLFLPYQKEVTLEDVIVNQESFLSRDENIRNQGGEPITLIEKSQLNVDVPIDDNGQTALHLAATLGKVKLVRELLENGANRFRGDNDGQTALNRVVYATNCYELACFDELLDLLYPTIKLIDNRGRTILHHIALTSGLKGRYDSSKYYLETLLEWVVKKGSQFSNDPSLTLKYFLDEIVNKSDKYGNTCLNYATLAGHKYIVSQLLDIGADPYKPNKVGVKPDDLGIDINKSRISSGRDITRTIADSQIESGKMSNIAISINGKSITDSNNDNEEGKHKTKFEKVTTSKKTGSEFKELSNSLQLLDTIQTFITNLGKDFKQEIEQKSQQIEKLNPVLRDKTLVLSQKRKQYDELQKTVHKISKITNKIDNLEKAIDEEEAKFAEQIKDLNVDINQNDIVGAFDPDQPFTIPEMYEDVEAIVEQLLKEKLSRIKKDGMDISKVSVDGDGDGDGEANEACLSSFDILEELNSIKVDDILPLFKEKITTEKMEKLKERIPPSVVLDARIRAYEKNNKNLLDKMNNRRLNNSELENQFKRIIALCINTDPENIDDKLLSSLLMSVENDPDPEIGQIRKVLKIVGDLDGEPKQDQHISNPASVSASSHTPLASASVATGSSSASKSASIAK